MRTRPILLGLGSNLGSCNRTPDEVIKAAIQSFTLNGLRVVRCSGLYSTEPIGGGRQARFVNAVVAVEANLPPGALLRRLKGLEREYGRKGLSRRNGPRSLDLDILDYRGLRLGRAEWRRVRGALVLPHPEMQRRGFVLVPLEEVAPGWRHPVSGLSAGELLNRLPRLRRGVRRLMGTAGAKLA